MPRVILKADRVDQPATVDLAPAGGSVGSYAASVSGDAPVDLRILPGHAGTGRLLLANRVVPFHAERDGSALVVWIEGRTFRFEQVSALRRGESGPAARAASGEVHAPMPGTILRVNVKPGDQVQVDQPLVVMISMKMEMTLAAPIAGRVFEVAAVEGGLVDMNATLVKIRESSDAGAA